MNALRAKHCQKDLKDKDRLPGEQVAALMTLLHPDWHLDEAGGDIRRDFHFRNFYKTMAFVNGLALIAHEEDHHPELQVGYNHCLVSYRTHSANGLTENDFICAAKIDALPSACA